MTTGPDQEGVTMTDQRRSERLTDPTHTAGTPEARSAAHGETKAAKQPSPNERPAALDNLLAHIARRIEQIEAGTHAGHDSSTAQDGAANGTQIAVDSRSEPDAAPDYV